MGACLNVDTGWLDCPRTIPHLGDGSGVLNLALGIKRSSTQSLTYLRLPAEPPPGVRRQSLPPTHALQHGNLAVSMGEFNSVSSTHSCPPCIPGWILQRLYHKLPRVFLHLSIRTVPNEPAVSALSLLPRTSPPPPSISVHTENNSHGWLFLAVLVFGRSRRECPPPPHYRGAVSPAPSVPSPSSYSVLRLPVSGFCAEYFADRKKKRIFTPTTHSFISHHSALSLALTLPTNRKKKTPRNQLEGRHRKKQGKIKMVDSTFGQDALSLVDSGFASSSQTGYATISLRGVE